MKQYIWHALHAQSKYHHQLPTSPTIIKTTFKVSIFTTSKTNHPIHIHKMSAAPASWSLEGKVAVVTGSGTHYENRTQLEIRTDPL